MGVGRKGAQKAQKRGHGATDGTPQRIENRRDEAFGISVGGPVDSGEGEEGAGFGVEGVVVGFDEEGEGVEVEEFDGDVGPLGLVMGLAGEAAGGEVQTFVSFPEAADEAAHVLGADVGA